MSSGSGTGILVSSPSTVLTNANMRALLKANLHNDSGFTDPADLNTFLTMGQQRIVKDSPETLGRKQGSLSLTTLTRTYSLASDFYQICEVFSTTDSTFLEYVPLSEWVESVEAQASIPSGTPDQFTVWGFDASSMQWQIKFNYTPSEAMTFYYWYLWMPPAISGDSSNLLASLGFSDLLLEAATMYALQRNDPEGHLVATANYEKLLTRYRAYIPEMPAYAPILRPSGARGFSRLGAHFPIDSW